MKCAVYVSCYDIFSLPKLNKTHSLLAKHWWISFSKLAFVEILNDELSHSNFNPRKVRIYTLCSVSRYFPSYLFIYVSGSFPFTMDEIKRTAYWISKL